MDLITFVLLSGAILALIVFLNSSSKRYNLPPGPRGLPLLGHILFIGPRDYLYYSKLRKEFGDLCTVRLGGITTIVLNSYKAIQEAFNGQPETFSGRPIIHYLNEMNHRAGIILTDGPVWQEHRRFTLRLLRDFGVGRSGAEAIIADECSAIRERLDVAASNAEPLDCRVLFTGAINNVIARLSLGERCGTDDPNFKRFVQYLDDILTFRLIDTIPLAFPFIMKVPPLLFLVEYFSGMRYKQDIMHDYIREKIKEREEVLSHAEGANVEPANICDAYILERNRQEASNPGEHTFTEWQLIRNMMDLFLAGTETTATTMTWAILYLSQHPEIQEKMHKEILEHVGTDRPPVLADRPNLPFLCAVMDEVMRRASLLASNIFRRSLKDTKVLGYDIPANVVIVSNLYGVHHNPEFWEKPHEFYPQHFLTAEGAYQPSKYLIPFSIGKRACLGESLAKAELFMALATVFQHYRVEIADPKADIDAIMVGRQGGVRCPLPHRILFTKWKL